MKSIVYLEKKKLMQSRWIFRVGLLLMVVATVGIFLDPELLAWKIVLFVGLVPSLFGGNRLSSMYRCPRCGESLFRNSMSALQEVYVSECPRCQTPIEVEIIE